MILTFGDAATEKIGDGEIAFKLPVQIQEVARRKLRMIHNSVDIHDLRIPPANHLEKLTGNYKGFYSIRINKQWRIVFEWKNGNAFEVQIVDYH